MEEQGHERPDAMSAEDKEIVEALTTAEIETIDQWIMSSVEEKWKKIALIAARAIEKSEEEGALLEVPDVFFAMRVHHFCDLGILELRGDRSRMRYSEVRRVG